MITGREHLRDCARRRYTSWNVTLTALLWYSCREKELVFSAHTIPITLINGVCSISLVMLWPRGLRGLTALRTSSP